MRNLLVNTTPIWYALLESKTELTDEYGNKTGQYELHYSNPVRTLMNIRWNTGEVQLEGYGIDDGGRRKIVTDDINCPITVDSILWIGRTPDADGEDGAVKHNYVCTASVEKSINQIAYIVQEVNVS